MDEKKGGEGKRRDERKDERRVKRKSWGRGREGRGKGKGRNERRGECEKRKTRINYQSTLQYLGEHCC